eukprot:COSAG04_NODE_2740_length_3655_cov_1.514623_1_plen_121_part_10
MRFPHHLLPLLLSLLAVGQPPPARASYCAAQAQAACDAQPLCRAVSLYGVPAKNAWGSFRLHSCNETFKSENWTTLTKGAKLSAPPPCDVARRPCPHDPHIGAKLTGLAVAGLRRARGRDR